MAPPTSAVGLRPLRRLHGLGAHLVALEHGPDGGLKPMWKGWRKKRSSLELCERGWRQCGAVGIVGPGDLILVDQDSGVPATVIEDLGDPCVRYRSRGRNNGTHLWYAREGFDQSLGMAWTLGVARGGVYGIFGRNVTVSGCSSGTELACAVVKSCRP